MTNLFNNKVGSKTTEQLIEEKQKLQEEYNTLKQLKVESPLLATTPTDEQEYEVLLKQPGLVFETQKQELEDRKNVFKCQREKKVLYEYFTFPKRLQIKYNSPLVLEATNLPSTGIWKSKTSTTDRIKNYVEDKDSVYSKIRYTFNDPMIGSVDIYDERGRQVKDPDKYKNVTETWYFLVNLLNEPVLRGGGRTRKRRPKKRGRRKHTKSHYSKK